jgi:hypothetical protein
MSMAGRLGPRLASNGFVMIVIDTDSPADKAERHADPFVR